MVLTRATAMGLNGVIATPHYLASAAGLRVLQDGGNALDAAIALLAAQKAKGKTRRPGRRTAKASGNGEAKPARRAAPKPPAKPARGATAKRAVSARKSKTKPAAKKKTADRSARRAT